MKQLFLFLALAPAMFAQDANDFRWHGEAASHFSGVQANAGSTPILAWVQTIRATNAPWVRVEFGPTSLGQGSWLNIVSVSAQQTQRLNSVSIEHWKYISSALRGTEARVELWIAPGDQNVFANVAQVRAGERVRAKLGGSKTLCGGDSRTNTRDDRAGRIFGGGCTAWLTANNAICTAGHCGQGTINGFFEVNVPASDSDGTPNPAAPNDQFPVDDSNIRWFFNPAISDSANRGQEYTVCTLFPNSNTGEQAHTRGFFRLTQFVPATDTSTLRITGYGIDDTPTGSGGGRNSDNYTEQTATGPYRGQTDDGTRVYHSYTTDTEPANSGSPMIYRSSGIDFSIGIHTLGGCNSDGSGANSGTSFNKDTLSTAINTWRGANARHLDSVAYPGVVTRTGSVFRPANNLAEGYGLVPDGGSLEIIAGSYPSSISGNVVTLGVGQTKKRTASRPGGHSDYWAMNTANMNGAGRALKALILFAAVALFVCFEPAVQAQLRVRVSVKFILGSSGQRPSMGGGGFGSSSYALTSDSAVISNINYANELLTQMGRGYQYQLTEIQDVSGWSGFFSISARDESNKQDLESVANSNATTRAQFFYRTDAINIYINNSSSGYCSFPGGGTIIFAGSQAYDTLLIHEMGHYMSLAHTHAGEQFRDSDNSSCSAANCSCAILIAGTSDGFADTLPDVDCWTRSQMVAANPGATTTQIDNTFLNIMSYHLPQDRFTSDQFDAWTDGANSPRFSVLTGRTRFVATSGNDTTGTGTSSARYRTLVKGVTVANPGDIVLLRAGSYDEATTITKAVTLRATRGTAVIGL